MSSRPLGLTAAQRYDAQTARQLDRTELPDHVHALERILEELVVPVDPALARTLEELLLHDLVPEVVDLLDLGEEAVAAEVEAVAVAHLGAGDPADLVGGLEHDHGLALLGQKISRCQAGRTTAQHDDRMVGSDVGARGGRVGGRGVGHVCFQAAFW